MKTLVASTKLSEIMLSPMGFERTLRLALVWRPSIGVLFINVTVCHTLLRERLHKSSRRGGLGRGRGGVLRTCSTILVIVIVIVVVVVGSNVKWVGSTRPEA